VLRHWNTALDSWGSWAHLVEGLVPVKRKRMLALIGRETPVVDLMMPLAYQSSGIVLPDWPIHPQIPLAHFKSSTSNFLLIFVLRTFEANMSTKNINILSK
jgi:hypothetical protein